MKVFFFLLFFLPSFPARPTSVAPEERPTRRRGVDWRRMRRLCYRLFFIFLFATHRNEAVVIAWNRFTKEPFDGAAERRRSGSLSRRLIKAASSGASTLIRKASLKLRRSAFFLSFFFLPHFVCEPVRGKFFCPKDPIFFCFFFAPTRCLRLSSSSQLFFLTSLRPSSASAFAERSRRHFEKRGKNKPRHIFNRGAWLCAASSEPSKN